MDTLFHYLILFLACMFATAAFLVIGRWMTLLMAFTSLVLIASLALAIDWSPVSFEAKAEDDCPYTYGSRAISAVTGHTKLDGTPYVLCTYK
jgi:hypothetical protein